MSRAYEPAFPHPFCENSNGQTITNGSSGMTIRQYYKAKMAHALIAGGHGGPRYEYVKDEGVKQVGPGMTTKEIVGWAGQIADEMIAEDEAFESHKAS